MVLDIIELDESVGFCFWRQLFQIELEIIDSRRDLKTADLTYHSVAVVQQRRCRGDAVC